MLALYYLAENDVLRRATISRKLVERVIKDGWFYAVETLVERNPFVLFVLRETDIALATEYCPRAVPLITQSRRSQLAQIQNTVTRLNESDNSNSQLRALPRKLVNRINDIVQKN